MSSLVPSNLSTQSGQPSLPTEVWIEHVVPLLAPRELLRLTSSAKSLQTNLTHDAVFASALNRGGFAATSMERVMQLVADGTIVMPSPARLLRMANGRRCENRVDDGSGHCNKPRRVVNHRWGVFMCDGCVKTHLLPSRDDGGTVLFRRPYTDRCGEVCSAWHVTRPLPVSVEMKEKISRFQEIKKPLDELHSAKRKRDEEIWIANDARRERQFDAVVARLRRILREKEWVDIAFATWPGVGNIRFCCTLVERLVCPLRHTPAKASPAALAKITLEIRQVFDPLYECEFHRVEKYLSHPRFDCGCCYVPISVIRMMCVERNGFPLYLKALECEALRQDFDVLSSLEVVRFSDKHTVALAKEGRMLEALCRRNGNGFLRNAFGNAVPAVPAETRTFRTNVANRIIGELQSSHEKCNMSDMWTWHETYCDAVEYYHRCSSNIETYLSLDWVQEDTRKRRIRNDVLLMKRITNVKVWCDVSHHCFECLRNPDDHPTGTLLSKNPDFQKVLNWHKECLGRGKVRNQTYVLQTSVPQTAHRDIRDFFARG